MDVHFVISNCHRVQQASIVETFFHQNIIITKFPFYCIIFSLIRLSILFWSFGSRSVLLDPKAAKKLNSPLSFHFLFAKKYRWLCVVAFILDHQEYEFPSIVLLSLGKIYLVYLSQHSFYTTNSLVHHKIIHSPAKKTWIPTLLFYFLFDKYRYSWFICLCIFFKSPRYLSFKIHLDPKPGETAQIPLYRNASSFPLLRKI